MPIETEQARATGAGGARSDSNQRLKRVTIQRHVRDHDLVHAGRRRPRGFHAIALSGHRYGLRCGTKDQAEVLLDMVLGVDRQANKVDLPESALPYRQVVKPRTNKGENVDPVFVAHGCLRFAALGALELHLYPGNDCPGWVGDASGDGSVVGLRKTDAGAEDGQDRKRDNKQHGKSWSSHFSLFS